MTGAALVVQGNGLRLPLRDNSVDMIITSPPYWAQRDYGAGPGELGSEPTPQAYLEALWAATAEMMRVLKPTGSAFVDLGDKYSTGSGGESNLDKLGERLGTGGGHSDRLAKKRSGPVAGMPPKSLLLLPERYRVGCVDHLGLIARAVICWSKPNGLPESVTDRVRRSHEDWVHLVKQPRYYSATDEIREEHTARPQRRFAPMKPRRMTVDQPGLDQWKSDGMVRDEPGNDGHPLGKLPGSVWTIASEPLTLPGYFISRDGTLQDFLAPTRGRGRPRTSGNGHDGLFDADTYAELMAGEDAGAWRWVRATGISASPWPKTDAGLQLHTAASHYAAFPSRWPEQLIKGFSPPGICVECGQGRVPVVEQRKLSEEAERLIATRSSNNRYSEGARRGWDEKLRREELLSGTERARLSEPATILGYACSCTPFTDHPGTGEPSGPDKRYGDHLAAGNGYPSMAGQPTTNVGGGPHLSDRPKVGPWREYHLDRWTPPPTRPAVVLDCFGGTGTTAMVARALGRIGVSVDLSHAYSRAARWRVRHDGGKAISRTNLERQGSLL